MASNDESNKNLDKGPSKIIDRSKADHPTVMGYRAAVIDVREADARFAAAEARVASTIANSDEQYKPSAAAAAYAARSAVSAAKSGSEDILQFQGDRINAQAEYEAAISMKNSAEARMREAEAELKKDEELSALAYILAKEDSFEKEIAMSLLEETEIQILSKKYNVSDSYTRSKYKKEKIAVQSAEAEAEDLKQEKQLAELEADQAKKKSEKLANYIAEYEEFNDAGLVDKRQKELAEEAKEEMQEAIVVSIETQKELENLTRQLAEEEQELEIVKEQSEIYKEIQDRMIEPLNKAQMAKSRGDKLPDTYREKLLDAAEDALEVAKQIQDIEQKKSNIARMNAMKRKWGAFKVISGLTIAASAGYFMFINPTEYLRFAVPCFIGAMSLIGFGVKEWEDQIPDIEDDYKSKLGQSLTVSLSRSLIDALTQPQRKS